MADIFEVINNRSSIRGYAEEKLTEEEIRILLESGLKAPTARNEQEIAISVVYKGNPVLDEIQQQLAADAQANFYYDAPVVFFLSGKKDFSWTAVDSGIAVENIHLAAQGLGLGSVIIGCVCGVLTGEQREYFEHKLQLPEGYEFTVAIAIGHPAVEKNPHEIDVAANVRFIEG